MGAKPGGNTSAVSTRWRPRLGALGVLLTLALVVSPHVTAAAEDDGYLRVKVKEVGISLLVPEDWDSALMTREQAKRLLAENPAYRDAGFTVDDLLTSFAARWDGNGDGYPDRWISVDGEEAAEKSSLTPNRWRRGVQATGLEDVKVERTKVAGKPVLLSTATGTFNRDDGVPYVVFITEYAFANRDDDVISVGFYRLQLDDPEYQAMIDTMIGSLKLLR